MVMKSVSFENVRKVLSEISNEVKYGKEKYILTKNNKPYVGIVPVEMIYLVQELLAASQKNKAISKILDTYAINITEDDINFLRDLEASPGKLNTKVKEALETAKGKISNL